MQFLLYCLCGGMGVSLDYLIYYISLTCGMSYQAANILGYLSGTLLSFFLNRKITFRIDDDILRRLFLFLLVATTGFLTSAFMLWGMVNEMSVNPKIAKLVTLPVVVAIQFGLNRWITFREAYRVNTV